MNAWVSFFRWTQKKRVEKCWDLNTWWAPLTSIVFFSIMDVSGAHQPFKWSRVTENSGNGGLCFLTASYTMTSFLCPKMLHLTAATSCCEIIWNVRLDLLQCFIVSSEETSCYSLSQSLWCISRIILNIFKDVCAFLQTISKNSTTQWITCKSLLLTQNL